MRCRYRALHQSTDSLFKTHPGLQDGFSQYYGIYDPAGAHHFLDQSANGECLKYWDPSFQQVLTNIRKALTGDSTYSLYLPIQPVLRTADLNQEIVKWFDSVIESLEIGARHNQYKTFWFPAIALIWLQEVDLQMKLKENMDYVDPQSRVRMLLSEIEGPMASAQMLGYFSSHRLPQLRSVAIRNPRILEEHKVVEAFLR